MKIENMNNKKITSGKCAYVKPLTHIIKLETNYGIMEDRSIAIDLNKPAEGGGNAKEFDMSDDMWGDNHESDIDIFK